jgi:hypothetical protein
MDQKEFNHRSEMIRQQLGNDELLSEVNQEVFSDERVTAMAENIRGLRVAGRAQAEEEEVSRQRDLIDAVRIERLTAHGFQIDLEKLQEEAETLRLERVKEIHAGLRGDEKDTDLLSAFHLTDENGHLGEHSLKSPLFRERTRMAFDAYRTSVANFQALVDYNKMTGTPSVNVGRADLLRGEVHKAVAREVGKDLDIDDLEVAKKLVAKIRDGIMPGSGESDTYARSVLRVGRRLEKRYGNDIAAAVEEPAQAFLENGDSQHEDSPPSTHL